MGYIKVRFRCAPGTEFERVEVYAEMRKVNGLKTDLDEKEVEMLSKIDEYITNHKIKQQKSNNNSYQTIGTVSKDFKFTPD